MAIIKLTPSCKDYLWGGNRLRTDFGVQSDLDPLAEAWVLSCHPDGPSYLPDGSTLQQYIDAHPGCLGTGCDRAQAAGRPRFPRSSGPVRLLHSGRSGRGFQGYLR